MKDFDIFIIPSFTLDSNYNYDIKLIIDKDLVNEELFNNLEELHIQEDVYFNAIGKRLYYVNLSCLVDIKKWLLKLTNVFTELNIRSNLDSKLLDKAKELKK